MKNLRYNSLYLLRRLSVLLLAVIALIIFVGCDKSSNSQPKKIIAVQGFEQLVLPGEELSEDVIVRVEAGNEPIYNEVVRFRCLGGNGLEPYRGEVKSDRGGLVKVRFRAGNYTGDNEIEFSLASQPQVICRCRVLVGAEFIGANQEGVAGKKLKNPVGIRLVDKNGKPLRGIRVALVPDNCHIAGANSLISQVETDADGRAVASVVMPKNTCSGKLGMEFVTNPFDNANTRSVVAKVMSVNYYTLIINVLGGLAFFIFGMKMMSDGLNVIAGRKMQNILYVCTRNRFVAILAGAGVAAALQSSSAATVMLIGFVNAGLLNLEQAIGVIFGTHIGTTVTAQLVAFDVSVLALPAIIGGLLLTLIFGKKIRGWGEAVLGFGLLFFGMMMMSGDLKSIADYPSFRNFFSTFDCAPVDGWMHIGVTAGALLIGLLATLVLQSSAAVIGMVIALGAGGLVNFYTAVALTLGSNIGTTVTAQLAAIPANRIAKQTAMAHTLVNLIGALLVAATFWIRWQDTEIPVFFYFVNRITGGDVFGSGENMPRHIANAHTLFNILTTIVMLPFVGVIAKICSHLIVAKKQVKYQYLESHLLNNPPLAIEQAAFALRKMLKKSWALVDSAVYGYFIRREDGKKRESLEDMDAKEDRVDRYQIEIVEYLSQVMVHKLTADQALTIPPLIHCTNDAERIADRAANILALADRLHKSDDDLSDEAQEELDRIFGTLTQLEEETMNCLKNPSQKRIKFAQSLERKVSAYAEEFESAHIQRLNQGRCTVIKGVVFVELLSEFAAIARHFGNIAERTREFKLVRPQDGVAVRPTPAELT